MKEMHRPTFRPRNVDHSKPMQIIRELGEFYRKEDSSSLNWVKEPALTDNKALLESEVKRIIELFEKKKTIIIPKVESSTSTGEGKFTTHAVAYKQSEFVRPKHYIVYSDKNRLEPREKDYEATVIDTNFLKYEQNFISVEELETIISALENDINKGEMIPQERVKEIITSIIPDKKQHVDKLVRYWHTRREEFKKSLVRKFWKDQKHNDKHLVTTFRRREREKMKTRRNKKNEYEGLHKLKEIKDSSQRYLTNLISMMRERELAKRNILILQQMEFEAEANLYRNDKTNVEEKYKEFLKTLPKNKLSFISPEKEKENIKPQEHKISVLKSDLIDNNLAGVKTDSSLNPHNEPQKKPMPSNKRIRPRIGEKHTVVPQHSNDVAEIKKAEHKKEQSDILIKHRIRYNRSNKLVVDRYVQSSKSFSPFDDDFNKLINKFKIYNEDFEEKRGKKDDFDSLYGNFLQSTIKQIVVSDSEEETNFNSQVRTFSSSFKQFLKHKRSHPELSI